MLLALYMSVEAVEKREYKMVIAAGSAKSADKALSKALINAVNKVNGLVISQKMQIEEVEGGLQLSLFGNVVDIPSREVDGGFTKSYSSGTIKSYKVTDSQLDKKSGIYDVLIEAEVEYISDYKNIGNDRSTLIPLTVSLLHTDKNNYKGLNGSEPAAQVSERITNYIAEKLTASNKFRVLDRRNLSKALSEEEISQSLGSKTGQRIKLQQMLGADLFVSGNISQFDVSSISSKSYGASFEKYKAELIIDIRVIETATGEIRLAKRFDKYLNHDEIKSELEKYQISVFSKQESDRRRVQYIIESMMLSDIYEQIIKKFHPDYDVKKPHIFYEKKHDKTPLSNSPGSSKEPIEW